MHLPVKWLSLLSGYSSSLVPLSPHPSHLLWLHTHLMASCEVLVLEDTVQAIRGLHEYRESALHKKLSATGSASKHANLIHPPQVEPSNGFPSLLGQRPKSAQWLMPPLLWIFAHALCLPLSDLLSVPGMCQTRLSVSVLDNIFLFSIQSPYLHSQMDVCVVISGAELHLWPASCLNVGKRLEDSSEIRR